MMSRRNGTIEKNRVGETGVGEMGVGKLGQIIGETGVGEMGVGEMGVIPFYDRQVLHCYSFHERVPQQCRFRIPNSISKRVYRIKGCLGVCSAVC